MLTNVLRAFLPIALLAAAAMSEAVAQTSRDASPPSVSTVAPDVTLHLAGEAVGGSLNLRAILGNGVTHAVRIYSYPSETLLAMYVNSDIPAPLTEAWVEKVIPPEYRSQTSRRTREVAFRPGVTVTLQTDVAPAGDTTLKLLISGSWRDEDGIVREQEIPIRVHTNLGRFAFTYSRIMRAAVNADVRMRDDAVAPQDGRRRPLLRASDILCCGTSGSACTYECIQCSGTDFSCCKTTTEACGWCNKDSAICGLGCPFC